MARTDTEELAHAYTQYKKARKEARNRASLRVQKETEPDLIEVGRAVYQAQENGVTVTDIALVFGIKNRNFIYAAKRAYADHEGLDPNIRPWVRDTNTTTKKEKEADVEETTTYLIDSLSDTEYEVTVFGDTSYLHYDEKSGRVVAPEEWADADSASRQVYRDILRDIEGRHKQ